MNCKKIFFACTLLLFAACQQKKELIVETTKDLSGTWRITKVTRNAADITQWVDSTGFRLVLNNDNTYTLGTNNLPFLVTTNGTWAADDPQYPYHVTFVPGGGKDSVSGSIGTPVIMGERSLSITLNPGCFKNTYIYTLEKMQ